MPAESSHPSGKESSNSPLAGTLPEFVMSSERAAGWPANGTSSTVRLSMTSLVSRISYLSLSFEYTRADDSTTPTST